MLGFLTAFVVETSFCFDTKVSWFGKGSPSPSNQAGVHDTLGSPCHQGAATWPWVCSSLPGVKQKTENKMVTEACLNFPPDVWIAKLHNLQRGAGEFQQLWFGFLCLVLVPSIITLQQWASGQGLTGSIPCSGRDFPLCCSENGFGCAAQSLGVCYEALSHANGCIGVYFTQSHPG